MRPGCSFAASLQGCGGRERGGLLAPKGANDKEMQGFFVPPTVPGYFLTRLGALAFCGWIVSPLASIATNFAILAARVSAFLALWVR